MSKPPNAVDLLTKNYVFVNVYNRDKPQKVIRACGNCRKRKIRCGSALDNGPWPCGACVRLKRKCVQPTLYLDESPTTQYVGGRIDNMQYALQNTTFSPPTTQSSQHRHGPTPTDHSWTNSTRSSLNSAPTSTLLQWDSAASSSCLPPGVVARSPQIPESGYHCRQISASNQHQSSQSVPTAVATQSGSSTSSDGDLEYIIAAIGGLTDQMGDLRVEITGASPWISNHNKGTGKLPVCDEPEVVLPANVMSDSTMRIPAEMMPSDERVMDYFGYYFNHVHPYVPVLNKKAFYGQWQMARKTVSPLLLEAIFASVSRYLDCSLECKRWLALAAKHEELYRDLPRVSTVQALIILMKAREFAPKSGYFYRSWMALKYIITMAMDLDMHEHHGKHSAGTPYALSGVDCVMHTRIWQVLFSLELIIGGPQERSDAWIQADSVTNKFAYPAPETDVSDYQCTRRQMLMVQAGHAINMTSTIMKIGRRNSPVTWALDPAMGRHDIHLDALFKELSIDVQMFYPEDGSPPWLGGDHYLAHAHAYSHLVVIMHHRPQLQIKLEMRLPDWRRHLDICLDSAAKMCRLQEALLRDFGIHGLNFMLRGINFTVYCVLTCVMVHLVAITYPDLALNSQARCYLTRHMRVLEQCTSSTQPDLRGKINALRKAFSRDTSKPFELKESLSMQSLFADQFLVMSAIAARRVQPPAVSRRPLDNLDSSWSLSNSDIFPKTTDSTINHTQSSDETTASVSMAGGSAGAVNTNSSNLHTSSTCVAQDFRRSTSAVDQEPHSLPWITSNEWHAASVWDLAGDGSRWKRAFGPQFDPQQSSSVVAQSATSSSSTSLVRQPMPHQPVSTIMQVGNYQPGAAASICTPLQHASIPDGAFSDVPIVTPDMWEDVSPSAYDFDYRQQRLRDEPVDSNVIYYPYKTN